MTLTILEVLHPTQDPINHQLQPHFGILTAYYLTFSGSGNQQSCLFTAKLTLLPPSPIPTQAAPPHLAPAPPNAQATQPFNNHPALTTTTSPSPHPQASPTARSPMGSHPNPLPEAPPRSSPPTKKRPPTLPSPQRQQQPPSLPRRKRWRRAAHPPANTTSSREKEAVSTSTGATATSTLRHRATDDAR